MVLGVALVGEHQAVAVDDAGRGREQRAAVQNTSGSSSRDRGRLQPFEIGHAVGRGLGADLLERRLLGLGGGDDQLAAAPVRHAVLGAVGVELVLAGDAAIAP